MKKQIKPPKLVDSFFQWYCRRASIEDLHGDAEELFYSDLKRMSAAKAKFNYWKNILSFVFSYAVKRRRQQASLHEFSSTNFNFSMIKSYFLIASRSLVKHRFFTIINVLGLAIGMSISLLLIAMLSFLWRYDNFHVHKDRIARVTTQINDKKWRFDWEFATAPAPLADKLREEQTGIEQVVRVNKTLSTDVVFDSKQVHIAGYFVDENFLEVFTFPLLKGNPRTALQKPNSIIITEKAAVKLFGTEDAFGKIIQLNQFGEVEIAGIMKDVPKNSHFQFEALASYQTLQNQQRNYTSRDWEEFRGSYIYLLLADPSGAGKINAYLDKISKEHYNPKGFEASFRLQNLMDIVPGPGLRNQIGPEWEYLSLSIFSVLTILILLPACFNYANISISRALKRMKEIGLRKTMGGLRSQIFSQFILETVIISLIALCCSFVLFTFIREEFLMMLVEKDTLDLTPDFLTLIYFAGFAVLVGIATGIVPALYFSGLNPIEALKNKLQSVTSGLSIRKILIVAQFALSVGFIMAVVVVVNQYKTSLSYDFGFHHENILDVDLQGTDHEIVRHEFSSLAPVSSVSMSSDILGASSFSGVRIIEEKGKDSVEVVQMFVDENYISNLKLELLAGKNFSPQGPSNGKFVVVNEEFIKAFHINSASQALNRTFILPDNNEVVVIGVLRNFHYSELSTPISNFFFRYDTARFNYANVKVSSSDFYGMISMLDAAWKKFGKEKKFTARFMDDEIEEVYSVYFSMIKICGFLGVLAISISCLGLLGMVVFTVENRMKELGVRKVMGASSFDLTILLSKNFFKLLIVALCISLPLTYWFFEYVYLRQYAYHVSIGTMEILTTLTIVIVLGLGTILSQTVRAASQNPIDTLRYE